MTSPYRDVPKTPGPPVGGGTPSNPVAIDPRGLVPINRTQPVATDNGEAQRMMERRLGTMPPSSFAGAGAGFVPTARPTAPAISNWASQQTDAARAEMAINRGTAAAPPLSQRAIAQTAGQARYALPPQASQMAQTRRSEVLAARDQRLGGITNRADRLREALARRPRPSGLLGRWG